VTLLPCGAVTSWKVMLQNIWELCGDLPGNRRIPVAQASLLVTLASRSSVASWKLAPPYL